VDIEFETLSEGRGPKLTRCNNSHGVALWHSPTYGSSRFCIAGLTERGQEKCGRDKRKWEGLEPGGKERRERREAQDMGGDDKNGTVGKRRTPMYFRIWICIYANSRKRRARNVPVKIRSDF